MRSKYLRSIGFLFGALLVSPVFSGPQAAQDDRHAAEVTLSSEVQPIFDAYCVACHQSGDSEGSLNLEEGMSYRNLVSQMSKRSKLLRIAPGKPEESYLLHKMEGTHIRVGGEGEQMPDSGPLDKKLIDTIRKWILDGAKNG
jgi:hypothetical protein